MKPFRFVNHEDGLTTVTSPTGDEFAYTTVSGPQSADVWILQQVKDHLCEFTTEKPPEPAAAPAPEEDFGAVEEADETGARKPRKGKK